MIFVGDIALPYRTAIVFQDIPSHFYKKRWFGNLEGPIVKQDNNKLKAVYNLNEAITELISCFNFEGFALANNHILDTGRLQDTIDFLNANELKYCGLGSNFEEANKEIVFYEDDIEIVMINFGWEVIQCEITLGNNEGVNPLQKNNVLNTISDLVKKYPNGKIIPFMHWSYELEAEPQPFERELAMKMIDYGAAGVLGCHPHRIGGFELYKNKPIIYSLGNWMFQQGHYHNFKHKFPEFCNQELAFEWDFAKDEYNFHFFDYNKIKSCLTYQYTEGIDSVTMKTNTPFKNLSNQDYKKWYKSNHYHRNKGLPIYYWEDSESKRILKNKINLFRDFLISLILKLR